MVHIACLGETVARSVKDVLEGFGISDEKIALLHCLSFRKLLKSKTRTDTETSSETDDEAILFSPFQLVLACDKLAANVHFVT